MSGKPGLVRLNFELGNATDEMGANVVRLRWRRIVGIAPDVQIEVVLAQRLEGDDAREAGYLSE